MDWKTWVGVGLSIAGLIVWQMFYAKQVAQRPQAPPPTAAAPAVPGAPTPAESTPASAPVAVPTPAEPVPAQPAMEPHRETIRRGNAEYVFNNDAGGIEEVLLLKHTGEDQSAVFLNRDRKMPIGALGQRPGEAIGGFEMEVDHDAGAVLFTRRDPDGLLIRKRFLLPPPDDPAGLHTLRMLIELENSGSAELERAGYFVSAGGAAPIHAQDLPMYTRFDWYRNGKMTSIDVNWFSASTIPLVGIQTRGPRETYMETRDRISWVGVTSQYFCTILTSEDGGGVSAWARRFDTRMQNQSPVYGIQGAMGLPGFRLAPGEKAVQAISIYAGPKDLLVLKEMRQGQSDVMRFGMFGIVSEFLLWAMDGLYRILGNYAAAIIVLTLIIKTVLWPIQNHSTQSMRRMSLLSPKMTELREKYKDNPQKMNEELMKLYKEYGINPFSGCIPMLIQIPIFFGFYSMLGSAIQLRNASFLWIHDLSQPDTIAHVLGFPVNLLPLIMAATMVWQMVITPKTGDAMQQRIFYFMPVVFLVFCYNFASALALYWTTQNIFSILQLYLTRNRPLPTLEKKSVAERRPQDTMRKGKKKGRRKP